MNKKNVVGESMRELSHNELNEIYGGDDPTVSPRSTFICSALFTAVMIITKIIYKKYLESHWWIN